LERVERETALAWYRRALPFVDAQTQKDIEGQIKLVEAGSLKPMRDPFEE